GQYLQPSANHLPVVRYLPPEEFERWREVALEMGFHQVVSGPLVRSSYGAGNLYEALRM
ncbi:MAG: lipoyl synthase, partial [Proteobacteria bacterium]|nr:lipoyl synthase [Pseudomonadota bacterium]